MNLDPELSDCLNGTVTKDPEIVIPGCAFYSPQVNLGLPDILENNALVLHLGS